MPNIGEVLNLKSIPWVSLFWNVKQNKTNGQKIGLHLNLQNLWILPIMSKEWPLTYMAERCDCLRIWEGGVSLGSPVSYCEEGGARWGRRAERDREAEPQGQGPEQRSPEPRNASSFSMLEEAGKDAAREPLEGLPPHLLTFQIFRFQHCERINSPCFKPPILW